MANKPEKTLKAGAVSVSIFKNSGEYGIYRTCTVSIRFKKGTNWEYGHSMKVGDAIIAAQLLDDARKYMMLKDAQDNLYKAPQTTRDFKTDPERDDEAAAGVGPDDEVPF